MLIASDFKSNLATISLEGSPLFTDTYATIEWNIKQIYQIFQSFPKTNYFASQYRQFSTITHEKVKENSIKIEQLLSSITKNNEKEKIEELRQEIYEQYKKVR